VVGERRSPQDVVPSIGAEFENIEVLEEQLIGVDVAYFSLLIAMLRDTEGDFTLHHLSELIDKVFNEYEEPADEEITIKQSKMNYYLDRIHRGQQPMFSEYPEKPTFLP
jgi:hypothetical protein